MNNLDAGNSIAYEPFRSAIGLSKRAADPRFHAWQLIIMQTRAPSVAQDGDASWQYCSDMCVMHATGTTTATVLTRAIFSEGCKSVAAGMNPMDLRRGINLAVEKVVDILKSRAKMISTTEEIAQVGHLPALLTTTTLMLIRTCCDHGDE